MSTMIDDILYDAARPDPPKATDPDDESAAPGACGYDIHQLSLMQAVAELSDDCICRMSDSELVFAIRAARVPLLSADDLSRLPLLDRTSLERLAHVARNTCRHRLTEVCSRHQDRCEELRHRPR